MSLLDGLKRLFGFYTGVKLRIKAVHIVLRPTMTLKYITKTLIPILVDEGYNTLVVNISRGLQLDHMPWIKEAVWKKYDASIVKQVCRDNNINLIPEWKFLTHQLLHGVPVSSYDSRFLYNADTLNPTLAKCMTRNIIDELNFLLEPNAIHIGHDEVAGFNDKTLRKLKSSEQPLPSELFLHSVNLLYDYIASLGIETWMWGDMLLSPGEFPNMNQNHMHGTLPGYGSIMRKLINNKIVICDWHYSEERGGWLFGVSHQSSVAFQKEGFKVIGVAWKDVDAIRQFTYDIKMIDGLGMMVTTWNMYDNLELLENHIRKAGRIISS